MPFKTTSELISTKKKPSWQTIFPIVSLLTYNKVLTSEVFLPMCSKKQNQDQALFISAKDTISSG